MFLGSPKQRLLYTGSPKRLTWHLSIHPWKRKRIFQTIIFRFHVNLRGLKIFISSPRSPRVKHFQVYGKGVWEIFGCLPLVWTNKAPSYGILAPTPTLFSRRARFWKKCHWRCAPRESSLASSRRIWILEPTKGISPMLSGAASIVKLVGNPRKVAL